MADAVAALVVEADLGDQVGAQPAPLPVAVGAPAVGLRGAVLAGLVRLHHPDELAGLRGREPRRMPDDVQLARRVVEAQDQRADRALGLAGPPADDRAVDGAHALHLDHPGALAGQVRGIRPLGDDALGAVQPWRRLADVGGRGDELERAPRRPPRAPRAARSGAPRAATRRRGRAGRTRRTSPAARPRAARSARRRDGFGPATPRSPRRRRARGSRSRRRARAGRPGNAARGSSGRAACRFATARGRRRRRRRRPPGSRRAWARTASPHPRAARLPNAPAVAAGEAGAEASRGQSRAGLVGASHRSHEARLGCAGNGIDRLQSRTDPAAPASPAAPVAPRSPGRGAHHPRAAGPGGLLVRDDDDAAVEPAALASQRRVAESPPRQLARRRGRALLLQLEGAGPGWPSAHEPADGRGRRAADREARRGTTTPGRCRCRPALDKASFRQPAARRRSVEGYRARRARDGRLCS